VIGSGRRVEGIPMREEREMTRHTLEGMEEALEHARGEQELETHTVRGQG